MPLMPLALIGCVVLFCKVASGSIKSVMKVKKKRNKQQREENNEDNK